MDQADALHTLMNALHEAALMAEANGLEPSDVIDALRSEADEIEMDEIGGDA